MNKMMDIFQTAFRLGLTSFGGPTAHLGYFREEYVIRKKWLDDQRYADLIALCQFLPGPASSQVGMAIGMMRGGFWGGVFSWLGFTLPSVLLMAVFAYVVQIGAVYGTDWIHGLKLAAIVIVAQAIWGMGRSLAPDKIRATIAILAAAITLIWPSFLTPILLIILSAIIGSWLRLSRTDSPSSEKSIPVSATMRAEETVFSPRLAIWSWVILAGLLALLPILRHLFPLHWLAVFDSFFRTGALVFGGGHVVLPLLEKEVVASGWISEMTFFAGYGAAQAVPGPLFTFASYLGAVMGGWSGVILATLAIFLPSFLMVAGALPFWHRWRNLPAWQSVLAGVNAAVVGVLLATFYDPLWTGTVLNAIDFSLIAMLFLMRVYWKWSPWLIVFVAAVSGWIFY